MLLFFKRNIGKPISFAFWTTRLERVDSEQMNTAMVTNRSFSEGLFESP